MTPPEAFRLQASAKRPGSSASQCKRLALVAGPYGGPVRGACEPLIATVRRSVRWNQPTRIVEEPNGRPAASPDEQSVPIASLAKVMVAYLTLKRYPLSGAQDGFTITVSAAQTQAEARDAAQHQSVVAVRAGEQLTERRCSRRC